jgi:hypothetical protein
VQLPCHLGVQSRCSRGTADLVVRLLGVWNTGGQPWPFWRAQTFSPPQVVGGLICTWKRLPVPPTGWLAGGGGCGGGAGGGAAPGPNSGGSTGRLAAEDAVCSLAAGGGEALFFWNPHLFLPLLTPPPRMGRGRGSRCQLARPSQTWACAMAPARRPRQPCLEVTFGPDAAQWVRQQEELSRATAAGSVRLGALDFVLLVGLGSPGGASC